MLTALERLFSPNPPPHVLDMKSENPVVRQARWYERLVAWFSKWLPFKSKNIFFINAIGLKNIQQVAEESLLARDADAEARRVKWARAKVALMSASSKNPQDPDFKERITTITTVVLQQISLYSFSPTQLRVTEDQKECYIASINDALETLTGSFAAGRLNPAMMQEFCTCIDHLSQLTEQDPKELMKVHMLGLIHPQQPLGFGEERQRLADFKYLAQDYRSAKIVAAKTQLAQELFIDCFRRHLAEASQDAFVQLVSIFDGKCDLLLNDLVTKARELLPALRVRLALDFIAEISTPSLKGYKHLLEYTPLFKKLSETIAKESASEVLPENMKPEARTAIKAAYNKLEENNRKEPFFTEEELADVRALCETILPGSLKA